MFRLNASVFIGIKVKHSVEMLARFSDLMASGKSLFCLCRNQLRTIVEKLNQGMHQIGYQDWRIFLK